MGTKFMMNSRQKKGCGPFSYWELFFEGFDDAVINIALPYIMKDFGITTQMSGYALSIIAVGTMVAFFVSRMADTIGRRQVFFIKCLYVFNL